MKKLAYLVSSALIILAAPVAVDAQTSGYPEQSVFVNVGVGAQPQRHDLNSTSSFPLYDETATVEGVQRIRNGALYQVGAGVRVMGNFGVGFTFSSFGRPGTGTATATIPHPVFYSSPSVSVVNVSDLAHTERGFHPQLFYFVPISEKLDLSLFGGPSFIRVTQDLPSVTVAAGTQNVSVAKTTATGTAKGMNAGGQVNYVFTPRYALGLFANYAGGKVTLNDTNKLTVGGLQTGLALQLRF